MQKFVGLPEPHSYRVNDLFRNNIFTIPSYQREYSWDSEEALDLLHDIVQVAKGKEHIHFFGSVVILPSKSKSGILNMIIDGQQRISTSAILIAIFRDVAIHLLASIPQNKRTFDNKVAANLNEIITTSEELLFKNNSNDNTRKKSLSLVVSQSKSEKSKQNYRGYFNGLILRNGTAKKYYDPDYKPIKLVHRVHDKMRSTISRWIRTKKDLSNKVDLLSKLIKAFTSRFYVVLIKAPTREDAITVYMTLNNRGKDLSTSDIVKGQLAGVLEDNDKDITNMMYNWSKMAKTLNNDNKLISYFIREYWEASHSVVTNSQLARIVIHNVTTPDLANRMIKNLLELVPIYKTLCDPSVSDSSRVFHFSNIIHKITMLNIMGLKQYYPIIMAMYHKRYDEQNINKVINIIEKIEMRRLLAHSEHSQYSKIAKQIWNGKLYNLQEILNILSMYAMLPDTQTKLICASYQHKGAKSGKGVKIISYMLAGIYALNGDFDSGKALYQHVFFNNDYHIIHLALSGINSTYKDYMGNWTILENDLYSDVNKHRNMATLIKALNKSKLKANQLIAEDMKSNINNHNSMNDLILKRQNNFANKYIKVW